MALRELESGAIQLHILRHAARTAIYGSCMVGELTRHGYTVSYSTLYPMLHRLAQDGLLVREERVEEGRVHKYDTTTERGRRTLAQARHILTELHRELVDGKGPDP